MTSGPERQGQDHHRGTNQNRLHDFDHCRTLKLFAHLSGWLVNYHRRAAKGA
jgi:hypothetical protein